MGKLYKNIEKFIYFNINLKITFFINLIIENLEIQYEI